MTTVNSEVVHPEDVEHPPPPLRDRMAAKVAAWSSTSEFIAANVLLWIVWFSTKGLGIDPYPFGFLTIMVSLEAILLSCAVLVGQRLEAERSTRESEADLKNDAIAAENAEKISAQLDRLECLILKGNGEHDVRD